MHPALAAIGWLAYNGQMSEIQEIAKTWLILNMAFAGLIILNIFLFPFLVL